MTKRESGWSLGPVQSRYILEGEGGDQVCGRAACGLPLTDGSFANLPPHFLRHHEECLTTAEWEEYLPGYKTFYPVTFREVIPYLFASLVYHQPYLATLSSGHPLFLQRVWTSGVLIRMKDMVGAGCNCNPVSKLTATGVPPHLIVANSVAGLREELREEMCVMKDTVVTKLVQLPEALKHTMLDNFQVEGTVPITRQEMQDMMMSTIGDLKTSIETSLQAITLRSQVPTAPSITEALANGVHDNHYATWQWGGRFHPVPQDFKFPV